MRFIEKRYHYEKILSTRKNMYCMPSTIQMEKKMGTRMG